MNGHLVILYMLKNDKDLPFGSIKFILGVSNFLNRMDDIVKFFLKICLSYLLGKN